MINVIVQGNIIVTRIKRGGYIFVMWVGDHEPKHIHVFRDDELILKWDALDRKPILGVPGARLKRLLDELEAKGRL